MSDEEGWEFYLRHLGRDGTVKAIINPLFLSYTKRLYGGGAEFGLALSAEGRRVYDLLAAGQSLPALYQNHPERATVEAILAFEEWDIVEIWLRNRRLGIVDATVAGGRGYVRDTEFVYREFSYQTDDDLVTTWAGICESPWALLDTRAALWPAGVDDRSLFEGVAAETAAKTIVAYNCATLATTGNGRYRDGDLSSGMGFGISVAADQGRGNAVEMTTSGGRILGIIQRLAAASGGEFTLSRSGDGPAWVFDFQPGQAGDDKRDRVIFSVARKNMVRPRLRRRAMGRATVAVAAGQGQGDARIVGLAEGEGFAADNDIEMYVDARDLSTVDGLEARAAAKLYEQRPQVEINFGVAQTTDTFYSPIAVGGRNTYNLGDACRAEYFGSYSRQVVAVSVDWQGEEPDIQIETESIDL